ncbi:MAG: nuclear transport factor 2 family protein [Anaerolineales bacterium]
MDNVQPQAPVPEPVTPPPATPVSTDNKRSNRNQLLIIAGLVLVVCLGVCVCVALGGGALGSVFKEQAPVKAVIDDFMKAMLQKDTEKAYSLFSARVRRQIDISELEKMIKGNNYILFEGYQSIEINNFKVSTSVNTNQNLPQGKVATVNGIVYYSGDIAGKFDAVLEKEGDTWRIHNINVTVPPDKLAP